MIDLSAQELLTRRLHIQLRNLDCRFPRPGCDEGFTELIARPDLAKCRRGTHDDSPAPEPPSATPAVAQSLTMPLRIHRGESLAYSDDREKISMPRSGKYLHEDSADSMCIAIQAGYGKLHSALCFIFVEESQVSGELPWPWKIPSQFYLEPSRYTSP